MKKIILIGLLILGILLISGCKISFTTATITDAKSCTSVDEDNNPVGITPTFTPESPEINVWFSWAHTPKDTEAKAVWVYETGNLTIIERSLVLETINGQGHFSLTRPTTEDGWPAGDYRADIYLGDKLAKSVSFKVQAVGKETAVNITKAAEEAPILIWTMYTEPNFGFSFMYPEDWTRETKGNVIFIKGPVDEKGFIPNVNIQVVVSAELGGAYEDIDGAATSLFSQLSSAENYNLISDTSTTIDGENAREITTSYSYGELNIKQTNAYVQDPNTGTIYIIAYTATTISYSNHLAVYERVKETFSLPK